MRLIVATFVALLPAFSTLLAAQEKEPMHTKDSLATVKENVKASKAVMVDVREQKEWDAGHVKGAILMPQSKLKVEAEAAELAKKLDKSKVVYTYCGAGRRALVCGEILKKQGFDVRPLKAGFAELVKEGFEKAEK
jgi:rhodanese-related sulfurtransferase